MRQGATLETDQEILPGSHLILALWMGCQALDPSSNHPPFGSRGAGWCPPPAQVSGLPRGWGGQAGPRPRPPVLAPHLSPGALGWLEPLLTCAHTRVLPHTPTHTHAHTHALVHTQPYSAVLPRALLPTQPLREAPAVPDVATTLTPAVTHPLGWGQGGRGHSLGTDTTLHPSYASRIQGSRDLPPGKQCGDHCPEKACAPGPYCSS